MNAVRAEKAAERVAGALPEAALLTVFRDQGAAHGAVVARNRNERTNAPGTHIAIVALRTL